MRVRIGEKGRVTIPQKVRKVLGVREGDEAELQVSGDAVLIRFKRLSVASTYGLAGRTRVKLEDIEEAAGKE